MITGVHLILYTPEAQALRHVLRDAVGWDHVEAHDPPTGWQIFALPPAELAVHPSDGSTQHQICLMCDDLAATMRELEGRGLTFRDGPTERDFGITATLLLPGGVGVLLYEPTHRTAIER